MQKKKNNAVEKVENVTKRNANAKKASAKKGANTKKSVKSKKTSAKVKDKNKIKEQKIQLREQRKEQKAKALAERKEKLAVKKAEKDRELAEKRAKKAKLKAHKKAEREKAMATAIRERNRIKEERKQHKLELKAEKQKRRDMLKHETKKERAKRLKEEKALKLEQKRAKQEKRAELKRQKFLAKKARKEQKARNKQKNKERSRGFGGWLAAVISLGVASLILASVVTVNTLTPNVSGDILEASYRKSFYETVEQVNNMDLNLSKALTTKDAGALQGYLVDLAINSELAENDIQQLPLQDENKFYTTKLINQIGDYAKYLNKKLINGEELSVEEYENLERLYNSNKSLQSALTNAMGEINGKFSFEQMALGSSDNDLTNSFNELQNLSVEYPELIYDGPFSDGKDNREIKGLTGEVISEKVALEKFNAYFAEYGLTDVQNVGLLEGNIKCYNVQGEKDGNVLYAQISEKGGNLIMFAYAGSCNGVVYEQDAGIEIASKYLRKLGVENCKAVWANQTNNVYTINFAGEDSGVIIYPDLIKVRVCAETGMVIGMEATGYYTNHTDRVIGNAKISKKEAMSKVSDNIDIDTVRLAVVPTGETSEKLSYEITGTYNGETYYVYIDAVTGRQIELFKVIKSTEGELLM